MVFRKRIPKQCLYCLHCIQLDEAHMLCKKKGVVKQESKCIRFRYDPCKRIPGKQKALDTDKYSAEDFSL